jgi:hypothetical protein
MMKVTNSSKENTGGNVMVTYLSIEGGGKMKTIGINDECIVGYNTQPEDFIGDDELWVVIIGGWQNIITVRNELKEFLPKIYNDVFKKLIVDYGYEKLTDSINGEVLFVNNCMAITDPFIDDTGRFPVDPIECYGLDNILTALIKVSR